MILQLSQCLSAVDLAAVREVAGEADFYDGQHSAGRAARLVKQNEQADSVAVSGILRLIEQRLWEHDVFVKAARPKQFVKLMLSRYQTGMYYGNHVDEALINHLRTDISFTLFLSDSTSYEGGELVLADSSGERSWKLSAGELLLYPASYLHRVNPVSAGERLVVVGWLTSWLRDPQQRELVFDMEQVMHEEFHQRGKTDQYDRLSRIRNNLLRQWLDN